jgi:hypothetical protein
LADLSWLMRAAHASLKPVSSLSVGRAALIGVVAILLLANLVDLTGSHHLAAW